MPRQLFSTLTETPVLCQVRSRLTCPLMFYSVLLLIIMLCCAATSTFDLLPLTLNICNVWTVTWSNYVSNLSKIEKSAV